MGDAGFSSWTGIAGRNERHGNADGEGVGNRSRTRCCERALAGPPRLQEEAIDQVTPGLFGSSAGSTSCT